MTCKIGTLTATAQVVTDRHIDWHTLRGIKDWVNERCVQQKYLEIRSSITEMKPV